MNSQKAPDGDGDAAMNQTAPKVEEYWFVNCKPKPELILVTAVNDRVLSGVSAFTVGQLSNGMEETDRRKLLQKTDEDVAVVVTHWEVNCDITDARRAGQDFKLVGQLQTMGNRPNGKAKLLVKAEYQSAIVKVDLDWRDLPNSKQWIFDRDETAVRTALGDTYPPHAVSSEMDVTNYTRDEKEQAAAAASALSSASSPSDGDKKARSEYISPYAAIGRGFTYRRGDHVSSDDWPSVRLVRFFEDVKGVVWAEAHRIFPAANKTFEFEHIKAAEKAVFANRYDMSHIRLIVRARLFLPVSSITELILAEGGEMQASVGARRQLACGCSLFTSSLFAHMFQQRRLVKRVLSIRDEKDNRLCVAMHDLFRTVFVESRLHTLVYLIYREQTRADPGRRNCFFCDVDDRTIRGRLAGGFPYCDKCTHTALFVQEVVDILVKYREVIKPVFPEEGRDQGQAAEQNIKDAVADSCEGCLVAVVNAMTLFDFARTTRVVYHDVDSEIRETIEEAPARNSPPRLVYATRREVVSGSAVMRCDDCLFYKGQYWLIDSFVSIDKEYMAMLSPLVALPGTSVLRLNTTSGMGEVPVRSSGEYRVVAHDGLFESKEGVFVFCADLKRRVEVAGREYPYMAEFVWPESKHGDALDHKSKAASPPVPAASASAGAGAAAAAPPPPKSNSGSGATAAAPPPKSNSGSGSGSWAPDLEHRSDDEWPTDGVYTSSDTKKEEEPRVPVPAAAASMSDQPESNYGSATRDGTSIRYLNESTVLIDLETVYHDGDYVSYSTEQKERGVAQIEWFEKLADGRCLFHGRKMWSASDLHECTIAAAAEAVRKLGRIYSPSDPFGGPFIHSPVIVSMGVECILGAVEAPDRYIKVVQGGSWMYMYEVVTPVESSVPEDMGVVLDRISLVRGPRLNIMRCKEAEGVRRLFDERYLHRVDTSIFDAVKFMYSDSKKEVVDVRLARLNGAELAASATQRCDICYRPPSIASVTSTADSNLSLHMRSNISLLCEDCGADLSFAIDVLRVVAKTAGKELAIRDAYTAMKGLLARRVAPRRGLFLCKFQRLPPNGTAYESESDQDSDDDAKQRPSLEDAEPAIPQTPPPT